MLELRSLDHQTDLDLFRESYSWRPAYRSRLQPDRAPFETFIADDPKQIVVGLFNGDLQAVYVTYEFEPGKFETHYTSHRKAPRENVLWGAQQILNIMLSNGAEEVLAYVSPQNKPLCRFVQDIGFSDPVEYVDPTGRKFLRYSAHP